MFPSISRCFVDSFVNGMEILPGQIDCILFLQFVCFLRFFFPAGICISCRTTRQQLSVSRTEKQDETKE